MFILHNCEKNAVCKLKQKRKKRKCLNHWEKMIWNDQIIAERTFIFSKNWKEDKIDWMEDKNRSLWHFERTHKKKPSRQLQHTKKRKNNYRIKGCNPVLEIEHILALQEICHFCPLHQKNGNPHKSSSIHRSKSLKWFLLTWTEEKICRNEP